MNCAVSESVETFHFYFLVSHGGARGEIEYNIYLTFIINKDSNFQTWPEFIYLCRYK